MTCRYLTVSNHDNRLQWPADGYIGYYKGTTSGSVSVANGSLSRQLDMNVTITTHIPKVRMILSVRVEGSLYNYKQMLNEFNDGARGFVLEEAGDYSGTDTHIYPWLRRRPRSHR